MWLGYFLPSCREAPVPTILSHALIPRSLALLFSDTTNPTKNTTSHTRHHGCQQNLHSRTGGQTPWPAVTLTLHATSLRSSGDRNREARVYPHNPYSPSLSCIHTQLQTSLFTVGLVGRLENPNLPEREEETFQDTQT